MAKLNWDKFVLRASQFSFGVACCLVILLILTITYGVIGRYFLSLKTSWTVELSEMLVIYITLLGAPWVLRKRDHVTVDIVYNKMSKKIKKILSIEICVLCLIVFIILTYYGATVSYDNYVRGVRLTDTFRTPKYIPLSIITVGSILLFLESIVQLRNAICNHEKEDEGV